MTKQDIYDYETEKIETLEDYFEFYQYHEEFGYENHSGNIDAWIHLDILEKFSDILEEVHYYFEDGAAIEGEIRREYFHIPHFEEFLKTVYYDEDEYQRILDMYFSKDVL